MKALAYTKYGSPDELSIVNLPLPKQGSTEILVRVQFAGVNPVDWKIGEGRMQKYYDPDFPLVVGRDVAGTVMEVGSKVTKFSPLPVLGLVPMPSTYVCLKKGRRWQLNRPI